MLNESNQIIGFHRSQSLAERHAKKINGKIVSRRSKSGKFSKHGRKFFFELEPKELTRYTVGITFPYRKDYGSVLAQLYTSKWTSKSRTKRKTRDQASTQEAAIRKVEEVTNYPRGKFWFDLEKSIAKETISVDYEKRFAETIVVISEVDDDSKTTIYRRK